MGYQILIAEDLEDNRLVLKEILEDQNHQVWEAENGRAALQLFEERKEAPDPIDVVMTDIAMPEMDGLRLLQTLKKQNPELPVVIISAFQDVEKIIEALRWGACDYITKPYDEEDIQNSLQIVQRILQLRSAGHICLEALVKECKQFVLETNPDHITLMTHFLTRDLEYLGMAQEVQTMQVALIESLNNAIFHGNLELSSALKQDEQSDGMEAFDQEARRRMGEAPYQGRKVMIDYLLNEEKLSYTIRDEGPGFDLKSIPNPLDPENIFNYSGRGITMICSFCDEVHWNEQGNEITLIKYREPQA